MKYIFFWFKQRLKVTKDKVIVLKKLLLSLNKYFQT